MITDGDELENIPRTNFPCERWMCRI